MPVELRVGHGDASAAAEVDLPALAAVAGVGTLTEARRVGVRAALLCAVTGRARRQGCAPLYPGLLWLLTSRPVWTN